jgi:hypothetical protein
LLVPLPLLPNQWTCRRATSWELGDIWNVSLLLQDWFLSHSSEDYLGSFVVSCPAKILHVGATTLLSNFYAGGV